MVEIDVLLYCIFLVSKYIDYTFCGMYSVTYVHK